MEPQPVQPTNSNTKKNTIIKVVGIVISLLLIGVASFLWYQERSRADDLSSQVQTLNDQLNKAPKPSSPTDVDTETKETTYKAEVGKFTLTLPHEYVIIKNWDGGGEGAPVTELTIGKQNKQFPGVVDDLELIGRFSLFAIPTTSTQSSDFDGWIEERLVESPLNDRKRLADVAIDGATARVYELDGLNQWRKVFFENNGVRYEVILISADSDDALSVQIFNAFVKGIKFNS